MQIEQRGNDIYVRAKNGQDNRFSVEFAVDVPKEYNVDLRTGDGYIKVADIKGNVDAHKSEGNIKVSDVDGDLKANAPRGRIHLGKITGKSSVHKASEM